MDGFLAVTGAELDDAFYRRGGDDVLRVGFENAILRARQIIFRQVADIFEQFRAVLVVEMIGFEPARLIPKRGQDRHGWNGVEVGVLQRPDARRIGQPARALIGGEDMWRCWLCHELGDYKRKLNRMRPRV